ncbi:hypothetical protein AHAS_Ahas01G0149800 [Arachis hypogaea]
MKSEWGKCPPPIMLRSVPDYTLNGPPYVAGRHLSTIPLDPNIGKILLLGSIFQCLNPALTIAAALAYSNPFVLPINRKEEADDAKRSFAGDSCKLQLFEGWKEAKPSGNEKQFCWDNFLSSVTLRLIDDMRLQFLNLLSYIEFVDKSRGPNAYNQYSHDLEMVCVILCAGLYPNVVQCKRRGKRTAFYTKEVGKIMPCFCLAVIFPGENGEGIEMLGGYLHFSASKSVIDLIWKLHGELDKLLNRKIEEPGLDINAEGKGVVAAAVELLHSQTIR